MKFGRFALEQRTFFGVVEDNAVVELDGSPFGNHTRTAKRHALSALQILVPCVPGNFYCAGRNYAAHVAWYNARAGRKNLGPPETADVGYRSANALIASGESIVIPADSPGPVEFEGELVAIIGKQARNLSEADALSCVLGYTLGNDISERTWQTQDRTQWRSKNSDTFKPMGPFIVTGLDPMKLTISVRVNGQKAVEYDTGKMLFSAQHFIAKITRYSTFYPGDVLWLGTDGPTVPDLKDGDTVEVCNDQIGILRNGVVRANAS